MKTEKEMNPEKGKFKAFCMKSWKFISSWIIVAFMLVFYIWYRASMLLIVTRPIESMKEWYEKTEFTKDKTDFFIMIIFASMFTFYMFFGILWMIVFYVSLLLINILVYGIWKKRIANRSENKENIHEK